MKEHDGVNYMDPIFPFGSSQSYLLVKLSAFKSFITVSIKVSLGLSFFLEEF